MRDVKFRAWLFDKERMINNNNICFLYEGLDPCRVTYVIDNREINEDDSYKTYDNFELMQFTGLKDCEGEEIYEGDILEFNDNASARGGGFKDDKIIKGYVIFEEGMYKLYDYENSYDLYEVLINDEESKVIGNIYESGE